MSLEGWSIAVKPKALDPIRQIIKTLKQMDDIHLKHKEVQKNLANPTPTGLKSWLERVTFTAECHIVTHLSSVGLGTTIVAHYGLPALEIRHQFCRKLIRLQECVTKKTLFWRNFRFYHSFLECVYSTIHIYMFLFAQNIIDFV